MDRNEKSSAEERISSVLSAALQEEIEKEPSVSITPEELIRLGTGKAAKKKRWNWIFRGAAVACCLVLGFILPTVFTPSTAEKNTEANTQTQGDTVVIQQGDTEGSVGEETIIVTNWSEISTLGQKIEGLYIPEFVPEEYKFEKMILDVSGEEYRASYLFKGKSIEALEISQNKVVDEGSITTYIEEGSYQVKTKKGILNIYNRGSETYEGAIQVGNNRIKVKGRIKENQCIKIVEQFNPMKK